MLNYKKNLRSGIPKKIKPILTIQDALKKFLYLILAYVSKNENIVIEKFIIFFLNGLANDRRLYNFFLILYFVIYSKLIDIYFYFAFFWFLTPILF